VERGRERGGGEGRASSNSSTPPRAKRGARAPPDYQASSVLSTTAAVSTGLANAMRASRVLPVRRGYIEIFRFRDFIILFVRHDGDGGDGKRRVGDISDGNGK
jgi:hypothetical protein